MLPAYLQIFISYSNALLFYFFLTFIVESKMFFAVKITLNLNLKNETIPNIIVPSSAF